MFRLTCWIIALIGVALTAGCSARHEASSTITQTAPANNDPYTLVTHIQEASSQTKQLTDAQLTTLKTYASDPHMVVRLQAMAALGNAGPAQVPVAAAVARQGLNSEDNMTRVYALTALDHMNAPDTVALARSMASDHSHSVSDEAHLILKKRGLKS